jgi:hypothetical protein
MDAIDIAEATEDVLQSLVDNRLSPDDALKVLQFAVDQLLSMTGASTDAWIDGMRSVRAAQPV